MKASYHHRHHDNSRESYGSGGDREIELRAIMVDVDEVWDQEDRVGEFASYGCSCKHGPEESLCHRLFSTAQSQRCIRGAGREELDINLNLVYNVCDIIIEIIT